MGATLNRDLAALGSFLTWLRDIEGVAVARPRIHRERESAGRERWLSADELRGFQRACPSEWWPFFAVLFYTGARLGEVQGLRGADILLHAGRIVIHEAYRRVKSREAIRDVPIPQSLKRPLAAYLARVGAGPADLIFPGDYQDHGKVHRAWCAVCKAAGIAGATPCDARHTFAVHAAQAGVPVPRLQKLLGHATPSMTMRYMKHSPQAYLLEDGAAIADHMDGVTDQEREARAQAARERMQQI